MLGFYDINYEKSLNATNLWGGIAFGTFEKSLNLITVSKPDVVIITTPDDTHYEILKEVANHKPKLVIVEKPITTDLEQAKEIVELYKQKNIPIMVNYTRRFLPYYQKLKQRYKNGEFGKLDYANIAFNRGMNHTGTHAIDFMRWFFDDDLIGFYIKEFTSINYRIWQMQLFFDNHFWQEQRIGDMPVWDYYNKSHWHVIENAYNFLEGKEELKCTGEHALKTLEIAFDLKRSE